MLITAFVLATLVQDQIDSTEYKGWSSFKPGSSVTYKVTTSLNPQGGEQKSTLKSVGETELVLEMASGASGQPLGRILERKVPAKIPAANAPQNVKEGEEEIEVGGMKLKCKTKEFEVKSAGGKAMNMKVWISDQIPGMAAKVDVSADGGFKSSMVASAWEKK